jgi:DNA-binding transcriptional LysR family regulator
MPSSLEMRHLRAFVALVERGSATAAAQELGLAQSTVSEALAALERALGTRVIARRRGSHEVSLTAAGTALLPHARQMLATVEAVHVAVVAAASEAQATVEIVANESISTHLLPEVLATQRERWPKTRFVVSPATCPGVRAAVRDGECHLGLLLETDEPSSSFTEVSAGRGQSNGPMAIARGVPLVVFAHPSHPLLRGPGGRPIQRHAVASYQLFVSDSAGDFYSLVRRLFEVDRMPGPQLEPVGTIEGVKRGVLTGSHALGLLPAYALREELALGRVATLALQPPLPQMRLDALSSDSRPPHPAIPGVLEGLRAVLAHGP